MITKLNEPVSVGFNFDSEQSKVYPKWIVWNGRLYPVKKIGLHHTFRQGRALFHVFSVVSKNLFFRLILNTENLHWKVEQIADSLPN